MASPEEILIDLQGYRVLRGGAPLALSYREYALLVYLATHAGHPVTKRRLLEEGMGRHDVGGLRMVEEHIRRLKSKLERGDEVVIQETDDGYRFIKDAAVIA